MNTLAFLMGAVLAPAATPLEPVDAVSLALANGAAAEAAGDARALLAAAEALDTLGARPDQAAPSLSEHWRELARQRGLTAQTPPSRGRVLGPAFRAGILPGGAELSTQQLFLAGRKAVVALVPEGASQLDLHITGEGDARICTRLAEKPRVTCSWLSVFTTRVQIRVVNRSAQSARYYLVSN